MHMQSFDSLEDLNKFLTEVLGVEAFPEDMVPLELRDSLATGDVKFNVASEDENEDVPEGAESEEMVPVSQVQEFTETLILHAASAIQERDALAKQVEQEIKDHIECHEHFETAAKQIRLQGYAEALAAGLYPGVPVEKLAKSIQDGLMLSAGRGIAKIDSIRGI